MAPACNGSTGEVGEKGPGDFLASQFIQINEFQAQYLRRTVGIDFWLRMHTHTHCTLHILHAHKHTAHT